MAKDNKSADDAIEVAGPPPKSKGRKADTKDVVQETVSSLYAQFETDRDMERSGIRLNYGNGVCIIIARAGGSNTRFAKVFEAKTRPYRRQIESETLDPLVAESLLVQAFVESVILGWEGVKDRYGDDLLFTREHAIKLFTELPDLFADVREQATKAANFRAHDVEDDAGN